MPRLEPGQLRAILQRELPEALVADGNAPQVASAQAGGDAVASQPLRRHEEQPAPPPLRDDDAVVRAEYLPRVLTLLRDRLGYHYLSHITAVDYLEYGIIEVIYHLFNVEAGGAGQIVRVRVPRDHPVIPSITPIWPGANLQEREAWDLYGVRFPGHPYHRRIYMWEEFEGHPMRKDFEKIGDAYFHFAWKGEDEEE
ncbi:NADH-quinone oxidoreductase subunit C [Kallotenue papyrolyticum]|uniref:NADH-quinone oxidoreductase subunit C n=1 Tax=Kallotenue papyrolyticum TaxID=1325125 RepID=UPI0004785B85|nr:NADH-quinone oxidoreductase subunit C [Kallotenue papyrolyticum]